MDDEQETQSNWYRRKVGLRIERLMNRLIAGALGVMGFLAAYFSMPNEAAGDGVRWFGMLIAVLLFWHARACFVARGSIIEGFGDDPGPGRRKER